MLDKICPHGWEAKEDRRLRGIRATGSTLTKQEECNSAPWERRSSTSSSTAGARIVQKENIVNVLTQRLVVTNYSELLAMGYIIARRRLSRSSWLDESSGGFGLDSSQTGSCYPVGRCHATSFTQGIAAFQSRARVVPFRVLSTQLLWLAFLWPALAMLNRNIFSR
jgi:hypothetical protein